MTRHKQRFDRVANLKYKNHGIKYSYIKQYLLPCPVSNSKIQYFFKKFCCSSRNCCTSMFQKQHAHTLVILDKLNFVDKQKQTFRRRSYRCELMFFMHFFFHPQIRILTRNILKKSTKQSINIRYHLKNHHRYYKYRINQNI